MIKKNKLYIFIFFIAIIFTLLVLCDVPCIFKTLFNIPCPGCGMARAFREIFRFNLSKAFYYNILSIPLFIFFIYFFVSIIKDIIKKEHKTLNTVENIFKKYWILIIVLLVISEIVNIIHGI